MSLIHTDHRWRRLRSATVSATLLACALLAACGDPDSPGQRQQLAPDTGTAAKVMVTDAVKLEVPYLRSTRVIDSDRYMAGLGVTVGGGSRHVVVVDLSETRSASVAVTDDVLATAAWVVGGRLHTLAVACDEFAAALGGAIGPPECLRGHSVWMSMPNPLADEANEASWNVDATGETQEVGQLPVFAFAALDAGYFTDGSEIVRVDHDTGDITVHPTPGGHVPVGVCGDPGSRDGEVVVVMSAGDPDAAAEPNRRQTFADLAHARLRPDGTWHEISPAGSWSPDAPALGGRCVGTRPSLIDWENGEVWVLEGDDWTSWGRLNIEGFTPGEPQIGTTLWAVSSNDWVALTSPVGTQLLGEGATQARAELSGGDPGAIEWAVIREDGTVVAQVAGERVLGKVVR